MTSPNPHLHNPHLKGEPFFLEGTRPVAVLLMHGFTATCSEVASLGRVLNRAGYTTTGFLLPGHGTQPDDLNRTRWQQWAGAAETAYQELAGRYSRVLVGGESTGGLLALYLAIHHPEIAGILAFSPALNLQYSRFHRYLAQAAALFYSGGLAKNDLAGNTTWQGYRVNPLRAVLQLMRLQDHVRARLDQVRQPALIVQGRQDKTIDPASAQMVYERIGSPVKEMHWLEQSGHCVLLEQEKHIVNRLALDFIIKVQNLG